VTDDRAERYAKSDRNTGSAIDDSQSGAAAFRRHNRAGECTCAWYVKPGRCREQDPRGKQLPEVSRGTGEEVCQCKGCHRNEKQITPADPGGQRRQGRRTDRVGKAKNGDQLTGGSKRYEEIPCQSGQQRRDHETFSSGRESAERKPGQGNELAKAGCRLHLGRVDRCGDGATHNFLHNKMTGHL
jgi:hypothetical protein